MPLPDAEKLCATLADAIAPDLQPNAVLVGIHTGGVWVAERVRERLGLQTPLGRLDVSFYRDDYHRSGLHPKLKTSDIAATIENRPVILIDDVLFTGRTIRAAMNGIFDYGRPTRIDLAVLVDRGGRELPIQPRWCAHSQELPAGQVLRLRQDADGKLTLRVEHA